MENDEASNLKNFVLDSSIVIKWFCQEDGTDLALKLREKYKDGHVNLALPDLILYELANALRYNKKLAEQDINDAIGSVIDLGIDTIVPTKEILQSAIKLALQYNLSVYDAYYLALAKVIGFKLVTSDKDLYNKTKDLEITMLPDSLISQF